MGTYHNQWSYTSPSGTTDITINSRRSGANIIVDATVTCAFKYSNDYIAYDGEINFNMWCGSVNASANIKGYSDRWYYKNGSSRTRTCSMTISSTADSIQVGFNVTVPSGNSRFAVSNTTVTLSGNGYNNPGAPTWINVTPNPCDINSAPLVTWGGATAGSSGVLVYDVEVRQTQPNGSWTNWLRLANSQSGTSYRASTIKNTKIYDQTVFVGVKYQYKVRVWDTVSQTGSAWTTSSEVTVLFNAPTPPTSVVWNTSTAEPGDSITLRWRGASGGSAGIAWYRVQMRVYTQSTATWSNWRTMSYPTSTSYTVALTDSYNIFSNLSNKDLIQARVSVKNDYDQASGETYSDGYVTISGGNAIWIKVNDNWKEGTPYVKVNDTWREGTAYIKVNDTWREAT